MSCAALQSSLTASSSPIIMRAHGCAASPANASQPRPDGTTFAPTWQSADEAVVSAHRAETPSPRRADVLEEDALDGSPAQ